MFSAEENGHGSIAQLGEHLPYKQRVTGSSPVVPTKRVVCRNADDFFILYSNRIT